MRRRIDTRESFRDVTTSPHLALSEYDGVVSLDDPPLLLEDSALWDELRAAQDHLRDVEDRVLSAARSGVPLDEFEVQCGIKMLRMLSGTFDREEWDKVESALSDHASKTTTWRGERYTHLVVIVREPGMEITVVGFGDAKAARGYAGYAGAQWSGCYVCLVMDGPLV